MHRAAFMVLLLTACSTLNPPGRSPVEQAIGLRSWVETVRPAVLGSNAGDALLTPVGCRIRVSSSLTPAIREAVLLHEVGHCVDIGQLGFRHNGMRGSDVRGLLRDYATSNAGEAYAEAYAATYQLRCRTRQFVQNITDTPPCPLPAPRDVSADTLRTLLADHELPYSIFPQPTGGTP